mmetsp:Transcript_37012/g.87964  ORF Transcript_37012/g.87964 Transcript_37012/m.87964 type:complete len:299 (+) Transcript_37012:144-1040(+)
MGYSNDVIVISDSDEEAGCSKPKEYCQPGNLKLENPKASVDYNFNPWTSRNTDEPEATNSACEKDREQMNTTCDFDLETYLRETKQHKSQTSKKRSSSSQITTLQCPSNTAKHRCKRLLERDLSSHALLQDDTLETGARALGEEENAAAEVEPFVEDFMSQTDRLMEQLKQSSEEQPLGDDDPEPPLGGGGPEEAQPPEEEQPTEEAQPPAAPEPARPAEKVLLRCRCAADKSIDLRMAKADRFEKLMAVFKEHAVQMEWAKEGSNLIFYFDDAVISPGSTPEDLGCEEEDVVDVYFS